MPDNVIRDRNCAQFRQLIGKQWQTMSDMLEFRHVPHFYIYTPPAPNLNVGHRKQQLNLCTPTLKSGGQGDFILYSTARACKCCLIATVNRVVVVVVAVVLSTL